MADLTPVFSYPKFGLHPVRIAPAVVTHAVILQDAPSRTEAGTEDLSSTWVWLSGYLSAPIVPMLPRHLIEHQQVDLGIKYEKDLECGYLGQKGLFKDEGTRFSVPYCLFGNCFTWSDWSDPNGRPNGSRMAIDPAPRP